MHAFLDGRDTDPNSGLGFITDLQNHIKNSNTKLATMVGRYYAMDRDNRWERVKQAYDVMVNGIGEKTQDALAAIKNHTKLALQMNFCNPLF